MSRLRKFAVAGGTFSVALGIGFVMQNGDALAARFGDSSAPGADATAAMPAVAPATAAEPAIPVAALTAPQPLPEVSAPVPAAVVPPDETAAPRLPDAAPVPAALEPDPAPAVEAPGVIADACESTLVAETLPAAMVALTLDAPCLPLARITVHHQGLMFSALTDAEGQARLTAPALAETAVFLVDLGNGEGAVAIADVPEIAMFDRAVLQWQGEAALALHAYEFGAAFGEGGHVWSGAPRSPAADDGFLVSLGDAAAENPLMAEVYTYPVGSAPRSGEIVLSVEAAITAETCGREIAAQTIRVTPGTPPEALDLAMTLPGCDAVGDFLVMGELLSDIRVAAR